MNSKFSNIFFNKLITTTVVICCFLLPTFAQKSTISGKVLDTSLTEKGLGNVIVALINTKDSTLYTSIRTNKDGTFNILKVDTGKYILQVMYPKMADCFLPITLNDSVKMNVGNIIMANRFKIMEEVV